MNKYSVLKQYLGHTEFRFGQERLIDVILAGWDVLSAFTATAPRTCQSLRLGNVLTAASGGSPVKISWRRCTDSFQTKDGTGGNGQE